MGELCRVFVEPVSVLTSLSVHSDLLAFRLDLARVPFGSCSILLAFRLRSVRVPFAFRRRFARVPFAFGFPLSCVGLTSVLIRLCSLRGHPVRELCLTLGEFVRGPY